MSTTLFVLHMILSGPGLTSWDVAIIPDNPLTRAECEAFSPQIHKAFKAGFIGHTNFTKVEAECRPV